MLGIYFAHYVSLGLYLLAIGLGVSNIKKIMNIDTAFKKFMIWYICFAISTCFIFVVLQVDWIVNDHNDAVGDTTAYLWLVFDYLNALSYITGMIAIGVSLDIYKVFIRRLNRKSKYCDVILPVEEEINQLHELIDTLKKGEQPKVDSPLIKTRNLE